MTDTDPSPIWYRIAAPIFDEERAVLEAAPVPLDAAFKQRLVEAALAASAPVASRAPVVDELAARRRAKRAAFARISAVVAATAAVAAALILVPSGPDPGPVPSYRMLAYGRPDNLGDEPGSAPIRLTPGARLTVDLLPRTPGKDLVARGYIRRGAALIRAERLDPSVTASGRFHLSIPVDEVPELVPGDGEIVFVIGHPRSLPSDAALAGIVERGESPGDLRIVRRAVHVDPH